MNVKIPAPKHDPAITTTFLIKHLTFPNPSGSVNSQKGSNSIAKSFGDLNLLSTTNISD